MRGHELLAPDGRKVRDCAGSQTCQAKSCKTCFFRLHYPWVCEPRHDNGRNCPDWKGRDA